MDKHKQPEKKEQTIFSIQQSFKQHVNLTYCGAKLSCGVLQYGAMLEKGFVNSVFSTQLSSNRNVRRRCLALPGRKKIDYTFFTEQAKLFPVQFLIRHPQVDKCTSIQKQYSAAARLLPFHPILSLDRLYKILLYPTCCTRQSGIA